MPRLTNLVILVAAIATAAAGIVLAVLGNDPGEPIEIIPPAPAPSVDSSPPPEIKVYIIGEVHRPGVYTVREGARLIDVIDLAGGMTEEADPFAVNLAVLVRDQDQWTVPRTGEPRTAAPNPGPVVAPNGKVDINSAGVDTLKTLPGIGDIRAQSIVSHRQRHGSFEDIEDMLAVSGIGPTIFDGLRDFIEAR